MTVTKSANFQPSKDIPDLSGRVILITGGNNGLGKESILQLSKHNPSKIYMGSRNTTKAAEAIKEIKQTVPNANIEILEMNLASFKSIQKAATQVLSTTDRLDILVNNAGIMAVAPDLTEEGYEIQFGTNHMGHALLTKLLLPLLEKTTTLPGADVRIVNLSSSAHTQAPKEGILYKELKTSMDSRTTWSRYGQSKLANIYFTSELAKHHPNIKSVCVHPGLVQTNLTTATNKNLKFTTPLFFVAKRFFFRTVQDGARNQLWAATAKDVKQGAFYYPVGERFDGRPIVKDEEMAGRLWQFTEKELKEAGF